MIYHDEKMVLNSCLVIKMGIDQIAKNFVKSMSVKKFSYLGPEVPHSASKWI